MNTQDWLQALRANGYRVTEVQEALVQVLIQTDRPVSVEEIWDTARGLRPETGRATVFRTVEKLETLGLLRRIHGYHGCSRFLPAASEAFLLFICTVCGRAYYLDRAPLDELIKDAEQQTGHQIVESHLQLFGTCARCRSLK